MMRQRLSDITNSMPKQNLEKTQPCADTSKDYIEHLVKENMTLVKLVQEKEKIIQSIDVEIQNIRACLPKMQLQNWNFAQSNRHMLAELNLNKEKVKALQHEIAGREALIRAQNVQVKVHGVISLQKTEILQESGVATEASVTSDANKTEAASRTRSSGDWKTSESQQHQGNEVLLSKRRRVGRNLSNSRTRKEKDSEENMSEIDVAKFPVSVPSCKESVLRDVGSLLPEYDGVGQRSSISRPLRKAVEKVVSYRERSVKSKMRRQE